MTQPRFAQVAVSDTPWYHCVSRCVRRAFLCGVDAYSGISYEHRRGWIADRLQRLASVLTLGVAMRSGSIPIKPAGRPRPASPLPLRFVIA